MSLFDDIIVNTAAAVDAVGKIANEVVDKSKVRVSSVELKNRISSKFETLGRYVYDTHRTCTTDNTVVEQYVNDITVLINELKSLQDAIAMTNVRKNCPKCGCTNSNDSLYCKKCGASFDFKNAYTVKKSDAGEVPNNENEVVEAPKNETAKAEEEAPNTEDTSM